LQAFSLAPPSRRKSSPIAADKGQGDVLKQLTGLGSKARELKKLMDESVPLETP